MKSGHRVVVPALITSIIAAAPVQAQQGLDWSAVFIETAVDEVPRRLACPTLEYPRELQQAGIQGSVLLRFVVDTTGSVEPYSVEVLSSTHKAFEEPATTMIRYCRFRPGRVRGRAVRTLVQMTTRSSALQGAWTITEVSVSTPDTSWTEANPQPGLYIFVERHYSTLIVQGSEPRELLSDDPTDAERLAAWSPFIANSGTYEVSGTKLTVRPLVAKFPNSMSDNSGWTYTYRVEGDTLRLILSAAWAPEGGEIRYTLARRR